MVIACSYRVSSARPSPFHGWRRGGVALLVRGDGDDGAVGVDVLRLAPVEPVDQAALDTNGVPFRAVLVADAMHDPSAARLAEVTIHVAAALDPAAGPDVQGELVPKNKKKQKDAGGWEDGRSAKGRRRLLLALGAVAVIGGGRGGGGRGGGDGAA